MYSASLGVEFIDTIDREQDMLPKTAEYALRAIAWLSKTPDESCSADCVADNTQVPRRYLHKVLQDLSASGLVHSRSGPRGGYSLAKPPGRITILEVINAVSPLERIRHCPLGLKSHTTLCPLHRELDQAYEKMERSFGKVTILQLLKTGGQVQPLCDQSPD